ncbi:hypothetical protein NKH77_00925 [Streptomyces sp. M19]
MRTLAQHRGGGRGPRAALAALCSTALALALAALPATGHAAPPPARRPPRPRRHPRPRACPNARIPARTRTLAPGPRPHPRRRADGQPAQGFARFYQPGGDQNTGYPHSLTWSYFGLSEVMNDASDCAHYDWSILDQALDETASYGNQAAIRFYIEYPEDAGSHPTNAIPVLRRAGRQPRQRTLGHGQSRLRQPLPAGRAQGLHRRLRRPLRRRPRIGFIHMGLIGLWGEWHTWPYDTDTSGDSYPDYMPTDAHGAEIIQAYDSAFTHTKIEVRYPEAAGGAADDIASVGYHDDSFCFREGDPLAGVTLPESLGGASYSQLQKALEHGVENRWTTASMGGEVRPRSSPPPSTTGPAARATWTT